MDRKVEEIIAANSKINWRSKVLTADFDNLFFRFNNTQPYQHLETYLLNNSIQAESYKIDNKYGRFKEFPDFYLDLRVEYGVVINNRGLFAITRKISGYNGMRPIITKNVLDLDINILEFVNYEMKRPFDINCVSVSPKNVESFIVYVEHSLDLRNL